jgi:hypothetical protein
LKNLKSNPLAVSFTSIADIAKQFSKADASARECASAALDRIVGFPDVKAISETDMESLKAGFTLGYKEYVFKPKTYASINGHFVEASEAHKKAKDVACSEITLDYALSLTTHEFGTSFKDEPEKKRVIGDVRTKHSKYVSKRIERLCALGKEVLNERNGVTKKRADSIFALAIDKFFDAKMKSVKTRQQGGDVTADAVKLSVAVEAFWKAYPFKPVNNPKA